MAYSVSYA